MKKILKWLSGKKTYIVVIVTLALGTAKGFDILIIPEFVWIILGALGLGAIRSAAKKIEEGIKEIKR